MKQKKNELKNSRILTNQDFEDKKKLRKLIKNRNKGNEPILNELNEIQQELDLQIKE